MRGSVRVRCGVADCDEAATAPRGRGSRSVAEPAETHCAWRDSTSNAQMELRKPISPMIAGRVKKPSSGCCDTLGCRDTPGRRYHANCSGTIEKNEGAHLSRTSQELPRTLGALRKSSFPESKL